LYDELTKDFFLHLAASSYPRVDISDYQGKFFFCTICFKKAPQSVNLFSGQHCFFLDKGRFITQKFQAINPTSA
jgi:hypothetical protein